MYSFYSSNISLPSLPVQNLNSQTYPKYLILSAHWKTFWQFPQTANLEWCGCSCTDLLHKAGWVQSFHYFIFNFHPCFAIFFSENFPHCLPASSICLCLAFSAYTLTMIVTSKVKNFVGQMENAWSGEKLHQRCRYIAFTL